MADTKTRIVVKSGELFRRHGYVGTGLKQIAAEAAAPFGSIYHFFPGGKQELAAEVIRTSGQLYEDLVMGLLGRCDNAVDAMRLSFGAAAQLLAETDYADACPIAMVALEVAGTNEPLRQTTAEVFTSWTAAGTGVFTSWGYPADVARRLSIAFILALEGAFVLARTQRDTEPLMVAMSTMIDTIRAADADRS
jgi:AcrR family transcriptional regulator